MKARNFVTMSNAALASMLILTGVACTLHIAPDYSPETATSIVDTEKAVDRFYAALEAVPQDKRSFEQFSPAYQNVEVEIRSLILRSKIQPMNEKTTDMANTLLDLWQKKEGRHKESNTYSDALADADQKMLDGLLTSMALVQQSLKDSGTK